MKGYPLRFWLLKAGFLCYFCAALPTAAQIVPDATLPVNSSVTSSGDTSVIEQGTQAGSNLFHSFNQFSIPTGGTAKFNNALDVQNIFSRVTGGKVSSIDGLIKANGGANLFLLNPNGIIFGSNARLEIGGSFFASTANSINFADGFQFGATNPQATPLLSINVPVGLQFGSNSGKIVNSSRVKGSSGEIVGLQVQTGETLGLVGGEVAIAGGHLTAYSGRVELGSVGANNTVSLTPTNPGWLLGYQGISDFRDIRLTDAATIAVDGDGRGSIVIQAKNIDILSQSKLQAGISSTSQFLGTRAGDIALHASDVVSIDNSTISNQVLGSGNGGNININARSLFFIDNAQLSTTSFGLGNAGNITINALDTVSLNGLGNNGDTEIAANLKGTGNGGNISVNAPRVSLLNGATIVANTFGQGNAGGVEISATDSIVIDGVGESGFGSGVGSQVFPSASGNGGAIALNAPRVSISGGAIVAAHTNGHGNAGSIEIDANQVFLDGVGSNRESSGLGSAVFQSGQGNAGQIIINTDSLDVTNSASLFVASFGQGDAGSVTINALGAVTFDGVGSNGRSSNAFSTIEQESTGNGREINITANSLSVRNGAVIGGTTLAFGNGGNIKIKVNTLELLNGGQILTTSRAGGDAGNITVNANEGNISGSDPSFLDRVARIGRPVVRNQDAASGLYADTDANSTGIGGDIDVTTRSLFLSNGAQINVSSLGQGNSGDVRIDVANSLLLDNGAIAARSLSGQGGNIKLEVSDTSILRNNSEISTTAGTQQSGGGNGGNINIDTTILATAENSNINANAFQGRGGNILITAQGIFRSSNSAITASSERGLEGTVLIDPSLANPTQGVVELPSEIIDIEGLIANSCIERRSALLGSFVITGAGGLPTLPNDPANSLFETYTMPDKEAGSARREAKQTITNSSKSYPTIEAAGIYRLASGQLVLGRECP